MAVRSIIDVEVDPGGNFAKFRANFDRYQKLLKDSPKEWAKVTENVGRTRKEFDQIVKQQIAAQARARLMVLADKEALRVTTTLGDRWREIARNTRGAAAHIKDATTSLLKWTSLTGIISGLVGAGGLFGINRLAASVASGRRGALGRGLTYGQQASFATNFSRLVDPGSFLGAVAEARSDVTKRVGFYGAGLQESQLQGSTATIGVELLKSLKRIADQTDPKLYAQVIQARGLGQFVTTEDLRRLAATSGEEFGALVGNYRRNVGGMALADKTQRAWQDLSTQLTRAGQQIETTFVKGLLPLVPGIERLSSGIEKVIRNFLGSDTIKKWMDQVGSGLETFAKYLGTPEFERNVSTFAAGLGKIAGIFGRFVGWFGASGTQPQNEATAKKPRGFGIKFDDTILGGASWMSKANVGNVGDYIRQAAMKRKIDPDIALAVAKSEGFYNYVGDRGSSFGPYQLHYGGVAGGGMRVKGLGDEFTKATGLDARDPSTTKQQIDFALDQAIRRGWGPWHGWKGDQRAGLPPPTTVRIENNTGGNAIVTTNQLQGQQ